MEKRTIDSKLILELIGVNMKDTAHLLEKRTVDNQNTVEMASQLSAELGQDTALILLLNYTEGKISKEELKEKIVEYK